ncbi:hypothetical protein [Fibrella aestuarina]|nr:hypothetical protein [Fibrella aestuarina]
MSQRIATLVVFSILLLGCATYEPPRDINTPYTFPNRGGDGPAVKPPPPTTRVFVSNALIKLGIDPNLGGAITYLSEANGTNMINNHDYGRQVQNSLYSGPVPYEPNGQKPHPAWATNGWNPVQVGDYSGTPARSIEWRKIDSTHLYTKATGIQWPLVNVPGECTMEHWYELRDNTVRVRSRTTVQRTDTSFYNPSYQETPSVYLNGPYHRFVSYQGDRPFTNDAISDRTFTNKSEVQYCSENWAAIVNGQGRGIGLYKPNEFNWGGGFWGSSQTGDEYDNATGYVAALPVDQMDYNGVYEYEYVLIVGSVNTIRQFAYSQPRPRNTPDFVFDTGRKGWSYFNTRDQGWPIQTTLNVRWEGLRPDRFRVASPFMFVPASNVPRLYIQAAFSTNATSAHLIWTRQGDNDFRHKPNQELDFPIIGDGQMRVYEIDLSRVASWQGVISRIGLEPTSIEGLQKGGLMRLKSVTTTRP